MQVYSSSERLATPAGLEPATSRLEGECSIQLSYGVVSCAVADSHAALSHRRAAGAIASEGLSCLRWALRCARGHSGNCRRSFSLSGCADAARWWCIAVCACRRRRLLPRAYRTATAPRSAYPPRSTSPSAGRGRVGSPAPIPEGIFFSAAAPLASAVLRGG